MPNASPKNTTSKILVSRFLTHSGDQAWDFALPLAMVGAIPNGVAAVALYLLCVRIGHLLLVGRVCALIDRWDRLRVAKVGIGAQSIGVLLGAVGIIVLVQQQLESNHWSPFTTLLFATITLAGMLSSLGATLMDVGVAGDWIPELVEKSQLGAVNSRLKQIDLSTELGAPVVAGLILTFFSGSTVPWGVLLIGLWNLISFIPEYLLLRAVYHAHKPLHGSTIAVQNSLNVNLFSLDLLRSFRMFIGQPAAIPMMAYALLWVTILSPHGVLLAGWLKNEWHQSELSLGIFRGLGGLFGLVATLIFPWLMRRFHLVAATRWLVVWQALWVIGAGLAFVGGHSYWWLFFACILLSRIGLYGYSIGEMAIRQIAIPDGIRGRVNGVAQAMTTFATIGVYAAGTFVSQSQAFGFLVGASTIAVAGAAILFSVWSRSRWAKELPQ